MRTTCINKWRWTGGSTAARCLCERCRPLSEARKFSVQLGPFESYEEALNVAGPIHAEHEQDYGIVVLERDGFGDVRKVIA